MSDIAVIAGGRAAWRDEPGTGPDTRRVLQLALAGLWLLDALLQYQPMMFSRAFSQTLAATADGNPGFIARPITWDATLIQQHAVALNVVFAGVIWVIGEAFGMILAGGATDPDTGPLLALLALACWPARTAPGEGGRS